MSRILQFVIVLVTLNMIGVGILWYGFTNMQDKKAKEADLRTELAEENSKGQKLSSLKETLRLAENDKAALEKYLFDPSDENQIKLISQIEQLGSSTTGVLVNTTSLDLAGTQRLHGEFTISGTWNQLYYFLRLIEALPTRIVINRFEIKNTGEVKNGVDHWAGSLSVDFVSLKLPS